jgi:hypothetical protein
MLECSQCGLFHPPLKPGEKCPMVKDKDSEGNVINYDPFLRPLKDIISSQIHSKQIKNHKKLFGVVIVEITKFLENYEE